MNSKKILISMLAVAFVSIIATSCYYDKEDLLYGSSVVDCSTVDSKFSTAINPLMQSKCSYSGCHDAGTAAAGVVLENHTQVAASAGRINQRCIIEKTMPPGTPLSSNEIFALQCWINAGTPNN
jgi:uncharacterized membrane protein